MADKSNRPLTTVALNALKPGELVSDAGEHRGLRVSCGKSGVKTFIYRYRSPTTGTIRQQKIGRYGSGADLIGLAEARVEFLKLKALRDSGVCLVERAAQEKADAATRASTLEKAATLDQFTVGKLVDEYLSEHVDRKRSNKAAAECRRSLYGDAVRVLGDMPAAAVSSTHVYDMIMAIAERGANVQAGFVLRELTAAFEHTTGDKLAEGHVNPCDHAKSRLKRKSVRLTNQSGRRALNDAELPALMQWLPGSRFSPGQKGVLHFTLMTGCRTGEVCGMRWADVNLDAGVWYLKETKTGVPRNVQLSRQAVAYLTQQQRVSVDHVFPALSGGAVQQKTLTERMWFMRKSDLLPAIDPWTPHDLRRTVRTGLAIMGCPSAVAEAVLGHSRKGMEGTYDLHSYERECREWLQKWCDHLEGLSRG